jgi:hypothetical protein
MYYLYICKRATPHSKMRSNPIKPVKKQQHEDIFIFWT